MSAPIPAPEEHGTPKPHTVTVTVNEKEVTVPAPKATGLQIKQAAIGAGLPAQLDFVLSKEREHGNGDSDIVRDNQTVTVNSQSRFLLVAPDDNS